MAAPGDTPDARRRQRIDVLIRKRQHFDALIRQLPAAMPLGAAPQLAAATPDAELVAAC
jgi:hypothetical protein